MKITPEQAREALDAWICRPGMTQEQATILITEAFWALKERPNIDVQRVTDEGGAVDQRALGVNRVKIFERWKAIDTRDKREKFTALVPAIMEATAGSILGKKHHEPVKAPRKMGRTGHPPGAFTCTGAMVLCWHCDNQLRDQTSESLELLAQQNLTAWVIDVIRHAISGTQERELSLAELSWWAVCNQVVDALPEAVSRRSLGLPAEKICSVYRESDIVPGEQTATSILKQRTKNLAPLPYAHQQQKTPQEKTVVSITVDPESPESFMKLPKRRRWVKEKYTRWVKTQPCACCGMPADDPHHLIGHGQGGMGTKAHDLFVLPLCRKHHNELHTDTVAFEEKYGSQLELIFRFIDRALAIGVLA